MAEPLCAEISHVKCISGYLTKLGDSQFFNVRKASMPDSRAAPEANQGHLFLP